MKLSNERQEVYPTILVVFTKCLRNLCFVKGHFKIMPDNFIYLYSTV